MFSHKDLDLGIILHHESQFFVKDGFCIDTSGAYPMHTHEMKKSNYDRPIEIDRGVVEVEDDRHVPFGLRYEFLQSSLITFCDDDDHDDVACHVQVNTDWEKNNSVFFIHLLEFDFSKFPDKQNESRDDELKERVKLIKSFHIPLDVQKPRWGIYPFGNMR